MRTQPRFSACNAVALVLLGAYCCIAAQVTSSTTGTISSPSITIPSTCPSRSINYITHGLPQKCLTSSWVSRPSSPISESIVGTQTLNATIENASSSLKKGSSSSLAKADKETITNETTALPVTATTTSTHPQTSQTQSETASATSEKIANEESIHDADSDSPLDNANFLSFEEWKRQNLAKAGQSAENFASREGISDIEQRRRAGAIQNALDSLGEDAEIDLDFTGFVGEHIPAHPAKAPGRDEDKPGSIGEDEQRDPKNARKRSKDAGTTCKERYNYASFDCAATVLKTNPECKGFTSIQVENKDSYMLNVCSVKNKFLIVELCEDILIDTVVLANFEFFSSIFRTFRISVSDRYPVKMDKWKTLGVYEARNSREVQAFLVENPLIWARYLRIEFLTHYGNEYYCPVSLLRVHGTTMMEEFNHEMKGSRGEEEAELENELTDVVTDVPVATVSKAIDSTSDTSSVPQSSGPSSIVAERATESSSSYSIPSPGQSSATLALRSPKASQTSARKSPERIFHIDDIKQQQCVQSKQNYVQKPIVSSTDSSSSFSGVSTTTVLSHFQPSETPSAQALSSSQGISGSAATTSVDPSPTISSLISLDTIQTEVNHSNHTGAGSVKTYSSSTQPSSPNPTTQESFFKSVHKRLQQLEANSTLSLQYIEEQSRILRDAFSKVEKRQLAKTSNFLETLNTTVLTELREFRLQYDQIWQSTVLELSSQRELSQKEVSALSQRLTFLADEIVFQKRVAVLQFMLILLCLGFIMFPRHSSNSNFFELPPVVQNALNKSSTSLSRSAHFESPIGSPPSTRPSSRYGIFRNWAHRRSPSEESDAPARSKSPAIEFSPPTPESIRSLGDREDSSLDGSGSPGEDSPVRRPERLQKAHSSSPSPRSTKHNRQDWSDGSPLTPKANATWSEGAQKR